MRYYVTKPVQGGYAWWDVRDSQNENQLVASFFRKIPGAESFAREVCRKLNFR